ncbi:MAG: DMT family transporter [Oscillospiraceae bacterium]|nr:DMT family transporter [Oscillospiraceae bacterium]
MKRNWIRQNVLPVIAAMIWGAAFLAQRLGAENMGPFTFNAARSVIAFFFLLGLCLIRRRFRGSAVRSWRELGVAGACCGAALGIATWLQQAGMSTTDAGKAGFITALYIVIVPLVGKFLLKRKAPPSIWISVPLAAVGLYLLSVTESMTIESGDVYMILCAFVFSVQILLIDHFSRLVDGVAMSCAQFLAMTLLSALGAVATGETVSAEALRVCLWAILYAGIFSSGVAYTLQILAQKDSNPMVVSLLLSLEAVFAALFGALFRHERMTGRELLGCLLMFAAVAITQIYAPDDAKTPS